MSRNLKIYIANTDQRWFEFLSGGSPWQEVNFWQPSGIREFKVLEPGELFLFKLKAPYNMIAGGGIFTKGSLLPLSLAWEAFAESNGAPTVEVMRQQIAKYRGDKSDPRNDFIIGCRMIASPIFLGREQWLPVPAAWASNIVDGKSFTIDDPEALTLWEWFEAAITRPAAVGTPRLGMAEEQARFGEPTLIRPRLGQGTFRVLVTDAYNRRCAITGEKVLPALEAGHIKPYSDGGEHRVSNGILLRRDIHRLFDLGYVTVSPDYHFEVSKSVKEDFSNGKEYYRLHGSQIMLPSIASDHPDKSALAWHNESRFRT